MDDGTDLAVRKRTLTIATTMITVFATAWTVTYLLLGLPQAAVIPGKGWITPAALVGPRT